MNNIDLTAVREEIASLATKHVPEHPDGAAQDGDALLESARDRLQKYSDQFARKEIEQDQLEGDLSQDLLGLANMDKLKEAGLSEIRISEFAEGLIRILVHAAVAAAIGGAI
jgi:hypothetical protein